MADENPLYPQGDSFDDRWGGLPVEAPRFNYTPQSSLIESEPRKLPSYKLTPVEGDPFERAAERLRAPYKNVNDPDVGKFEKDDRFPYRSNIPVMASPFVHMAEGIPGVIGRGLTSFKDIAEGNLQVNDPMTGMLTPEAVARGLDAASIAGPGGLIGGAETGAVVGSGPIRGSLEESLAKLKPEIKSDYLYHKTRNSNDIASIEENGLNPTQLGNHERSYFWHGDKAEKLADSYGDKNSPILRVKKENFPDYNYAGNRQAVSTGEVIPPEALEVKGADGKWTALRSDTQKPGMAVAAMQPTFYSAVEHAVGNVKSNRMPADQWLGTLSNAKGVKPEEMDWIGLKEHLQGKGKEPVTKQEIQDFMNANKVELKEVNKGHEYSLEEREALADKHSELQRKAIASKKPEDWEAAEKAGRELNAAVMREPTKFSQYQLPGGENYREKLLTLPNKNNAKIDEIQQRMDKIRNIGDFAKFEEYQALRNERDSLTAQNYDKQYQSSHWDEPDVLAHVRMNDRTIEGKKSLHLEEIQSDWHQTGRNKGYKETDKNLSPVDEAAINAFGVPNAPFKKTWHELALKRMLREAAEKGYDRLSWTPGEAQAARYDLSKQVENIKSKGEGDNIDVVVNAKSGVHASALVDKNGKIVQGYDAFKEGAGKSLADYIGKEMAEKIIKKHETMGKAGVTWEGEGLKVGGEGMKGFYDKMIPLALEKIGKEHGVKVKTAHVGIPHKAGVQGQDLNVHYIDIPQSLKDQALGKGFPLFSGGHMFTPVAGNPHDQNNK